MKKLLSLLTVLIGLSASAWAVDVTVTMNTSTKTMTLATKDGVAVEIGEPTTVSSKNQYSFSADEGTYVLTGYNSSNVVDGTIEINITKDNADFQIWTATLKANSKWVVNSDYTIENYSVRTREGQTFPITLGANGDKALVTNGGSFNCTFVPSEAHKAEGYVDAYGSATFTNNANVSSTCPMGGTFTVSYPSDANFVLMRKEGGTSGSGSIHYTAFPQLSPITTSTDAGVTTCTYTLGENNTYNYRLWKTGKRTKAAMFAFSATDLNSFTFTDADLEVDPKAIDHNPASNLKYNVGNILVNINERGHLRMKSGQTRNLFAQRDWQLTNSSTANYFIEPDYHYTIVNLDGTPITIDNADTNIDPWATLHANSKGTALVLVNYDAIHVTQWTNKGVESDYLGGADWGACWPENTAVYVVTVDDEDSSADPNMLINEKYNTGALKNAGKYVDAEHDVFYYLDTEDGAYYTFVPSGISKVEIAYSTILANTLAYNDGFKTVTANEDGSYTLLLKFGRNIVKMTDASGAAIYQVLTAKPIQREIVNVTRPGSSIFQPGDQVKIQHSGLYHPANKMSGIYNMSSYVTFNGIPNGTELILGANQYNFAGTPSAQAVTITIPEDFDTEENSTLNLTEGVLQVNGYGDPIGNHRLIDKVAGRSPNFTAIAHKTYFGQIPGVEIPVTPVRPLLAEVKTTPAIDIVVKDAKGNEIAKAEDGLYHVTYGTYSVEGSMAGYRALHSSFTIGDDAEDLTNIDFPLVATDASAWDGASMTEPAIADGVYQIATGAELAWFANKVNSAAYTSKAVLCNDIDLADYSWTPIGGNAAKSAFQGTFDGQGYAVEGLYINNDKTYQGLFGYVKDATIQNIIVRGSISAKQYASGIAPYAAGNTTIDRCGNEADITTSSTYVAGICAYPNVKTVTVSNCYNTGVISGSGYAATITANSNTQTVIENNLALGSVVSTGTTTGNVRAASTAGTSSMKNNYVLQNYANGKAYETVVTPEQLASGEVAYLLGEAWGQEIGVDEHPVLGGMKVYLEDGVYSNVAPVEIAVATFENEDLDYLALDEDSHIPELTEDFDEEYGFQSGDFWFDMNTYSDWATWWGYGVANHTSTDFTGLDDQFNSVTGCGVEDSENYSVAYVSDYMGPVYISATTDEAVKVPGVYVTNAAYAFSSMLYGDSFAKKFAQGDWFKLTATGYDDDEEVTGTKDFYLADLRSKDKNDWYIINDWTYVDLSTLGKVRQIQFTLSSSDNGAWGMNTPAYFCLDNFGAKGTEVKPEGNYDDIYPTIELADKSEYSATEDKQYAELTYTRTFGTTKWQPLYVPFASERSAWGEDVVIAKVTTDDVLDDILTITYLEDDETVEANTPYFIKALSPCDIEVSVENTTLKAAESASITSGNITLTGTYTTMSILPDTYYVLHSGELRKTSNASGYNLNPMRWYASTVDGGEIKLRVIGEEETEIANLHSADASIEAIYSVSGARQNSLKSGINIIRMSNGATKKIIK